MILGLPHDFPVGDRVVVSGGRRYRDAQQIWCILTPLHQRHPIKALIEGGAKGADRLCRDWALKHDVPVETYEADWTQYDRSAGPLRNFQIHVDHIVPMTGVVFDGDEEWPVTGLHIAINLQPMHALQNQRKHNKISIEEINLLYGTLSVS
jgi:hypothetical protein